MFNKAETKKERMVWRYCCGLRKPRKNHMVYDIDPRLCASPLDKYEEKPDLVSKKKRMFQILSFNKTV